MPPTCAAVVAVSRGDPAARGRRQRQQRVGLVAHVREQHDEIVVARKAVDDACGRLARRRELRAAERSALACGGDTAFVYHLGVDDARECYLPAFEDAAGGEFPEARRIVGREVGADYFEVVKIEQVGQMLHAVVELVVAQRRRVVTQPIHQRDDRRARHRSVVDEGMSRAAVARIDQQHVAFGTILLYQRGQTGNIIQSGVDIVGGYDIYVLPVGGRARVRTAPLSRSERKRAGDDYE